MSIQNLIKKLEDEKVKAKLTEQKNYYPKLN